MGDAGGDPDWYGYCLDDPVNGNDPTGLFDFDSPFGRILKKGFDRSVQMAGGGAVAGAAGGLGVGAFPGAIAGGMIGFPVGMLEGTIKEGWDKRHKVQDDPSDDAMDKSLDGKKDVFDKGKKFDWKKFMRR